MTTEVDLTQLHCPMSYTQYSFYLHSGSFKACCSAIRYDFDPTLYDRLRDRYFIDHPKLIKRKQDLLNNIKNSDCVTCWKSESVLGTSTRISTITKGNDSFVTNNRSISTFDSKINKLELYLSRMCNLGCFMCGPNNSSTIEKILEHSVSRAGELKLIEIGNNTFTAEYREKFANSAMALIKKTIQDSTIPDCKISYLGGEPSLHDGLTEQADKFIEWSKAVPNKKFSIEIVTNGTSKPKLNERFLNMFKKYKAAGWNTHLRVSIDAAYEYAQVRHGTDFAQLDANLISFLREDSIELLSITSTMSNLSLPYIDVLAEYISDRINSYKSVSKKVDIMIHSVIIPEWMNYAYLPKKYARTAIENAIDILEKLRNTALNVSVDKLMIANLKDLLITALPETISQEFACDYFKKLHSTQSLYRKTYPDWSFYRVFPHLTQIANEYNIATE